MKIEHDQLKDEISDAQRPRPSIAARDPSSTSEPSHWTAAKASHPRFRRATIAFCPTVA